MNQLSPYAAQCLAALQHLLPDLAAQAVGQQDGFLISSKAPSGCELWISATEQELTVGFAEHHAHFGWYEGYPPHEDAAAADYVQKLRAGQLIVTACYEGETYISSTTQEVGQPQPPLTWFQRWRRRKQHQVIRQWTD
jgi:hypothetical protein